MCKMLQRRYPSDYRRGRGTVTRFALPSGSAMLGRYSERRSSMRVPARVALRWPPGCCKVESVRKAMAVSQCASLSIEWLCDLAEETGRVQCHLYSLLPTWRVISLDNTMFVSAFGETHEGHTSPRYRLADHRMARCIAMPSPLAVDVTPCPRILQRPWTATDMTPPPTRAAAHVDGCDDC